MKKSNLIVCGVVAIGLALGGIGLMGCQTTAEEPDPPVINDTVRYSEETNPYKDFTWQEIKDAANWTEKAKNLDEIYYQFEGSYSEAYQENYSRNYMVLNCYKDGGLHGTFDSEQYYGYWTNVDRRGNTSVQLHVLRRNDSEYNKGSYDVVCEEMNHDYYEYQTNMPVVMWNNENSLRSCLISGTHYSKVTGLKVSGGQTACVLGDSFTLKGLEITVEHANGKSSKMDSQWYYVTAGSAHPNCPVSFSGFDSSEKGETEVTVSYANTDVTATYKCNVMGLKGITLDTKDAKTSYHVGDELDTDSLIVNATREDDGVSEVEKRRYKVYGFDNTKEGDQELTVKYDDKDEFTAKYTVTVYGIDSIELDAKEAKKEYYVGDKIDKTGLVVKATFKDGATDEKKGNDLKITGFDSSAATESQEVTVEFQGLKKTYNVKIIAPEFNGNGVKIKIISPDTCEFTSGEKTATLNYTTMSVAGKTIYSIAKPESGDIPFTDEEFDALHKQYVLDRTDFSASMITIYKIPDGNKGGAHDFDDDIRKAQEVATYWGQAPGGQTEQRYLILDTDKQEATLTYKYWNAGSTDTFVLKYTLEGNTLTFTEQVSAQLGWGGMNFGKLQKVWTLNADFTATREPAQQNPA